MFSRLNTSVDEKIKSGIIPAVLDTMNDTNVTAGIPRQGELLATYADCTEKLAKTSRTNLEKMADKDAISTLLAPVSKHPKETAPVAGCLKALKPFAATPDTKEKCVTEGVPEACVNAMRLHPDYPLVVSPALDTMLQMCTLDKFASAVANKGGSRQVVKGMLEHHTQPTYEKPMELSLMVLERIAGANATYKTILPLLKLGAVDAVVQGMESFSRNENIEAVGARVLAMLLDKEGVEKFVDNNIALSEDLKKTKGDKLLPELSRAMTTVGYLSLSASNNEVMRDKDAAGVILSTLKTLDTKKDGVDKSHAKKSAFCALGQLGSTQKLKDPHSAIDYLTKTLRDPAVPNSEKVAVLQAIKSLSASDSTAEELVEVGAVEEILNLLKKNPHDENLAAAGFGALGGIVEIESGAHRLTKKEGVDFAQNWLADNGETAGPLAVEECMTLLSNLALIDDNVQPLLDNGAVDMLIAALDSHCQDVSEPQPKVLNAAVSLLGRLATTEDAIRELVKKGAVLRAVQVGQSLPEYLGDPEAMEALIFLLESCGMLDDVRDKLVRDGAIDVIMAAMSLNPQDEELTTTGSRALQVLMGSSSETIMELLKDVESLAKKLAKDPNNRTTQVQLDTALMNLGNLALVDDLVDQKTAEAMGKSLGNIIALLDKNMEDGPAKDKLISRAANALGRLPLIEGIDMEDSDAIAKLVTVLDNNQDNPLLEGALMFALANMLTGPDALKALIAHGGIDTIGRILNNSAGNAGLRKAAQKAMDNVRELAEMHPELINKDQHGMDALAALLRAHAGDLKGLRNFLNRMAMNGGCDALLNMLGDEQLSPEMEEALLRALLDNLDELGAELSFIDPKAISNALMHLLKERAKNPKDRAALLARQKEALKLLGMMNADALREFIKRGGIDVVVNMMDDHMDEPELLRSLLDLFTKMYEADLDFSNQLVAKGLGPKLKEMLKMYKDDEDLVKKAVGLLEKMVASKGVDAVGMDDELMKLVATLNSKFGLKADGLLDQYNNWGDSDMIGSRLDDLFLGRDNNADNIVEMKNDDGKVYYYDKDTGETSWERPQAYAQVIAAYEGLAKLTSAHSNNIQTVNPKALKAAVGQMEKHQNDPSRLTALAKALANLATNSENRAAIGKAGGLQAVIQALNGDAIDAEFAEAALEFTSAFAGEGEYQDQIARLGGIKALFQIMLKFMSHQKVVEKCLSALTNLAYNSPVNMSEIMKYDGVSAVQTVLKTWKKETKPCHLSLNLLSNLMVVEDNIDIIGQQCGREIVEIGDLHYKEAETFKAVNRCMGNMSYSDTNIRMLVEDAQCTNVIVKGMSFHETDYETMNIAIDVVSNFASIEEDPKQDLVDQNKAKSVYAMIIDQGGAQRILSTVQECEEPTLLMAGMDALANLANDEECCQKLVDMNVMDLIIDAMQKYDWDEALMERTVHLMAVLTYSESGIRAIVDKGGISTLLVAMEAHIEEPDFLSSAMTALKNISSKPEYRETIADLGGVDTVLTCMDANLHEKDLLVLILGLFVRMTMSTLESEEIAEKGMHVILKTINSRKGDADYLTHAYTLLGHLAFAESNLKIIVQYGGIGLIVDSICTHPQARDLMLRSIQGRCFLVVCG